MNYEIIEAPKTPKTKPLVTVITSTRASHEYLVRAIKSVQNQTYDNIQHLLYVDGADAWFSAKKQLKDAGILSTNLDIVELPYATGKNRFNGHKNYAAGVYQSEGEFVCFLDDDNWYEPDHIESCMHQIISGSPWTFSFRNIVEKNGDFICQDNCESLGLWPTCIDDRDFLVDVSCYFLPKHLALQLTPLMHVQARPPQGQMEIDRVMVKVLKEVLKMTPKPTYRYSLNYSMGGNAMSVQPGFFLQGNEKMMAKYSGALPWKLS